ncbi:hypothetical protein BJ508DRAFT_202535 [Ascobolus immersus RN42]|uniref:CBM1 domain-containing protein n=1 Tax=Ascobolus immersus RN42 TaxID=1160509 RepID=A0A3N4IRD6_ASCIM|nr:hypothetical protein BJ508DRAFT_202535 [Ascobolus immersus RN42]
MYTTVGGGYRWGISMPEVATDEFIGHFTATTTDTWAGTSFGGSMPNNLLLAAWPHSGQIMTSFRMASGYVEPAVYTAANGPVLTQLHTSINATHWSITYRCQRCTTWEGGEGGFDPNGEFALGGWSKGTGAITNPGSSSAVIPEHSSFGLFGINLPGAHFSEYSEWIKVTPPPTSTTTTATTPKPTTTATTTTTPPATTTTPPPAPTGTPAPSTEYDYIVVGGGAGGLVAADRLAQTGKQVLLIERGPPTTYVHGGRNQPGWLKDANAPLTRYDVPGLCNQIWIDSAGISCTDIDQMAGCVLGGGTAVNAGLFFKPPAVDWDRNFPAGWKSSDMSSAMQRVFSRIPSTDTPSKDGKRYIQESYNILAGGLQQAGWSAVTANNAPEAKNRTFAHTPFMYINGERGGPLATYLVTAKAKSNFKLVTDTMVDRVVRTKGKATGVDVTPTANSGYKGTFKLKSTGRVILSAGAFGTPKILLRSGVGPEDALTVVAASADKDKMVAKADWINLPVGYNVMDHTNTDVLVSHPNVVPYDFYAAWDAPIPADKSLYLNQRAGPLAGAAPAPNTMMWDQVTGSDGVVRNLQWTARVEGSLGEEGPNFITISQYLGTGMTSRGRITIDANLNMVTSVSPYLKDDGDKSATIKGIENLQKGLASVANLTWVYPAPGQTAADYVSKYAGGRRSNHWMGSAKLGTDDGRNFQGKSGAVVDLNTKVYGTDNIFVVDASIFPGHVTTNPSAAIMIAAEKALDKILALPVDGASGAVPKYSQCGGVGYTGDTKCVSGSTCTYLNDYYYQCL